MLPESSSPRPAPLNAMYAKAAKAVTLSAAVESVITPTGSEKKQTTFLRLDIGGQVFALTLATIRKRGDIGLLYRFANETHERRLELCEGFDNGHYCFERSSMLFHHIYLWYINGIRTQVPLFARENFVEELRFWGLANVFYPNFIKKRSKELHRHLSLSEKFRLVRFGKIRETVWHFVETPESSKAAHVFAICSILAVLVSNFCLILSSMPQFQVEISLNGTNSTMTEPHPVFEYIEYGCIAIFSLELLAKFVVCPDRENFFYTKMNMIDAIAIFPFYLENLGLHYTEFLRAVQDPFMTIRILRVMRVFRVIRLFKLSRHSFAIRTFMEVIWETVAQMGVVLIVVAIGMLFFSTLVYYVEKDEPNTAFESIPITMWWCVCTMSTVGYGDMVPETTGGKLVASMAIMLGVLILCMPITLFVDKFINAQQEEQAELAR